MVLRSGCGGLHIWGLIDFDQGSPVGFVEWFSVWLREAPSAEVIEESILVNALFVQ